MIAGDALAAERDALQAYPDGRSDEPEPFQGDLLLRALGLGGFGPPFTHTFGPAPAPPRALRIQTERPAAGWPGLVPLALQVWDALGDGWDSAMGLSPVPTLRRWGRWFLFGHRVTSTFSGYVASSHLRTEGGVVSFSMDLTTAGTVAGPASEGSAP